MERGADSLGARPNGRPSAQLLVKQDGRKPLFKSSISSRDDSAAKNKENQTPPKPEIPRYRPPGAATGITSARRNNSESLLSHRRDNSISSAASPAGSRIPKPAPSTLSNRKPMSLTEAYKLAEDEEGQGETDEGEHAMDASPSPAPRAWREKHEAEQNRLRKQMGGDHLDTKSRSRPSSNGSEKAGKESQAASRKGEEKGKSPVKPADADGAASRDRPDLRSRPRTGSEWFKALGSTTEVINEATGIPELVPGIEDFPLPSVEASGQAGSSPARNNGSPEKSFAWQVDEDFTAGDLQVSDSPRIKTANRPFANRLPFDENSEVDINSRTRVNNPGSRNTKLDEIRSREVKAGNNIPIERPHSRLRNTKLDDIRARETEAESQIPIPDRHLTGSRNTKLDEIRQREADGLSRRRLAAARLEEIREQNAMARSISPEETRPAANTDATKEARKTPAAEPDRNGAKSQWETGGERIPDTPVTVFKNRRNRDTDKGKGVEEPHGAQRENADAEKATSTRPELQSKRADSRNLLRDLARAASTSPAPEGEAKKAPGALRRTERNFTDSSAPTTRAPRRALTTTNASGIIKTDNTREKKEPGNGNLRPTVEFAGLRRVRSTESTRSKRSSMHSEQDPEDRIRAEQKLFDPQDNHSEKGSVRAPSPPPDSKEDEDEDGDVEATPQPKKPDPLTMPTPRVTGAYVETPMTVKVEKLEDVGGDKDLAQQEDAGSTKSEPWARIRHKRSTSADKPRGRDSTSEPGEDEKPSATTSTAVRRRRRTQSLPRHRAPLKNSAKLPSVKDDLRELQRTYNIDDSTLDDLEEIISGRKAASPEMEALLKDLPDHLEDDDTFNLELDRMNGQSEMDVTEPIKIKSKDPSPKRESPEGDLAAYDRMSKSLQTGLLGIRTAKQGIERLEGNLSHAEHRPPTKTMDSEPPSHAHKHETEKPYTACATQPDSAVIAYVHLPIPRFYTRQPHFRLTLLGIFTLLVSLWYAFEAGMCALYCAPSSCTSTPCVWSYDDPTFGTALPVKFDQWTTGGMGRAVFNSAFEEAEDWISDMVDAVYGRDILDIDVNTLSFEGKRAHRRRLRKKGLDQRGRHAEDDVSPEVRARWDAWHRARVAREKAKDARAMGYEVPEEEDESIGSDQRVW